MDKPKKVFLADFTSWTCDVVTKRGSRRLRPSELPLFWWRYIDAGGKMNLPGSAISRSISLLRRLLTLSAYPEQAGK